MDPGQSLQDLGYVQPPPKDPGWGGTPQDSRAAGPPETGPQTQESPLSAHHLALGSAQVKGALGGAAQRLLAGDQDEKHQSGALHLAPEAPDLGASDSWGDEDDDGHVPKDGSLKPSGELLSWRPVSASSQAVLFLKLPW